MVRAGAGFAGKLQTDSELQPGMLHTFQAFHHVKHVDIHIAAEVELLPAPRLRKVL
jgi:hypothetical protein